jgi:ankyrin repeat protein
MFSVCPVTFALLDLLLGWAAENEHEAVVKLLFKKVGELEPEDTYDQTWPWWAAEDGHEAVVKLLLEKGAELESKDNDGQIISC